MDLRRLSSRKAIPAWVVALAASLWWFLSAGSNLDFVLKTLGGSGWLAAVGFWLRDYGYWLLFLAAALWLVRISRKRQSAISAAVIYEEDGDWVSLLPTYNDAAKHSHGTLSVSVHLRLYNESGQDTRLKGISALLLRRRPLWFPKTVRAEKVRSTSLQCDPPRTGATDMPKLRARDHLDIEWGITAFFPPEANFAEPGEYSLRLIIEAVGEPPALFDITHENNPQLFA